MPASDSHDSLTDRWPKLSRQRYPAPVRGNETYDVVHSGNLTCYCVVMSLAQKNENVTEAQYR